MCGIVGVGGNLRREKLKTTVEAMSGVIAHRGPDDEGIWVGENFAFGMRRLSIIDLAGGHQPMWDEHAGIGVVYNGEVYNYQTLREKLEKAGAGFHTASDTEVVLKSMVLQGAEAVHDWNGMFAVAGWNIKDNTLLLIRDRMGVKPLYYFCNGSMLIFASEIKALLASKLFEPRLNRQALWDYLTFRYIPCPQTIWHGIWKLPPGCILEWSPGREPYVYSYWKTDVKSSEERIDLDREVGKFEELFLDSTELRLLASDVPVGVLLSGGLDSSSVAAAAVELGHKRFHTFSVGFSQGGEYSELAFARRVAEHLGVEHHQVEVDQATFFEMLPQAVRAADEPLADLTIAPLLAVSRLARQWVKVVLSGEGADEILAGYEFGNLVQRWNVIRRLQTLPPWALRGLGKGLTLLNARYGAKLNRIATIPLSNWNILYKHHMTRIWRQAEKTQLWPAFVGMDSDRILDEMYAEVDSKDPLEQMLSVYQKSWLVEDLLMKADKMTMAASLELRVPLLDYRLVEWANRQPVQSKVGRNGHGRYATKFVLRKFAEKRLPREIIERPKQGFPVPANKWLQEEKVLRWALDCLTGRGSRVKSMLNPSAMATQLSLASRGNFDAANKTWLLLVFEIWLRQYDVALEDAAVPEPHSAISILPN